MMTHDDIEAIRAARESGEFPGPREWMARYWTEQAAQSNDPSVVVRAEAGVATGPGAL